MCCPLGHLCWMKGFSMSGGDIGNKAFTTVQACKEYCAMTEGCVAFVTTAGTENKCWLKNKQHGIEVANPIGISVRMNCDAEGKPKSPIYFRTVLIVSVWHIGITLTVHNGA